MKCPNCGIDFCYCSDDESFYDANEDLDSYYDDEQCISRECEFCGAEDDLKHMIGCPNNETGYNRLMTEGYD